MTSFAASFCLSFRGAFLRSTSRSVPDINVLNATSRIAAAASAGRRRLSVLAVVARRRRGLLRHRALRRTVELLVAVDDAKRRIGIVVERVLRESLLVVVDGAAHVSGCCQKVADEKVRIGLKMRQPLMLKL